MSRIIFTGANLVDGTNPARPDSCVVVEGERITHVSSEKGAQPERRPDDQHFDLQGRTLMPGLISCHFHSTFGGAAVGSGPALGLEYPPAYAAVIGVRNLAEALSSGVTSVACSSTSYSIDPSLKTAVEDGLIPGPRMRCGSHELMATGDIASAGSRNHWMEIGKDAVVRICDGVEGVALTVRDEVKLGAEIVKFSASKGHQAGPCDGSMNFNPEELASAAETAHSRGAIVRAHACSKLAIQSCARAGFDIIDHADMVDTECIETILEAGSLVVPGTHYLNRAATAMGGGAFDPNTLPPSARAGFEETLASMRAEVDNMCRMLPELVEAGVKIASGDDYGTPFLAHGEYATELEFYVEQAGVAPLEVIRWATHHGAEAMGMPEDLGGVQEGKLADLLVVDGDPLQDIRCLQERDNLKAILKGGAFAKELPASSP